jgi:hypothetical protein
MVTARLARYSTAGTSEVYFGADLLFQESCSVSSSLPGLDITQYWQRPASFRPVMPKRHPGGRAGLDRGRAAGGFPA